MIQVAQRCSDNGGPSVLWFWIKRVTHLSRLRNSLIRTVLALYWYTGVQIIENPLYYVQNIRRTKLLWVLRFPPYPQVFSHELCCRAMQSYTGDGHNRKTFFCECCQGNLTAKVLSLEYFVLYGIRIYWSTQKQPGCKKGVALFKMASVKTVVKSKGAAKKWLWWYRLMAKNLITTIQVDLCCFIPAILGITIKFIWIAFINP